MNRRKRVLVVAAHYLPGFAGGGPIRSVSRVVRHESARHRVSVFTQDRDLNDSAPYPGVSGRDWVEVEGAPVHYLKRGSPGAWLKALQLARSTEPDVVYLNTVFSWDFGLLPALLFRALARRQAILLVAPRGQLDPGALSVSPRKKRLLRYPIRLLLDSRRVVWHASTQNESENIATWMGTRDVAVVVMSMMGVAPRSEASEGPSGSGSPLRVVWLSRISPKKDLLRSLRVLSSLEESISFTILGPIEDSKYWSECEDSIARMPLNIGVTYGGVVLPDQVPSHFEEADVFLFMTRGENFGHVVAEALSVGCPVVTTKATPWGDVLASGGGLEVEDDGSATSFLRGMAERSSEQRRQGRQSVWGAYSRWFAESESSRLSLFDEAIRVRESMNERRAAMFRAE